jgi:hypothetical protein
VATSSAASPQPPLSERVARLQAALSALGLSSLQVQARLSGHRLLLRLEGEPLPDPDWLLESLLPTLEEMALSYRQRQVELFGFPPNEGIPEWHREWRYQPPPNPNSPLYRARQGDEEALQEVLNYLLHPEGIRARVHLHPKLGWLQINLQAAEAPDPAWAKDFVRRVLTRLELTFVQRLRLSGQKLSSFFPSWSQEFDLKQPAFWHAPPARLSPFPSPAADAADGEPPRPSPAALD